MIVTGVLVALAADSWWDGVGERKREDAYLEALAVDLARSIEQLEESIRADSLEVVRNRAMLELLRAERTAASVDWREGLGMFGADVTISVGTVQALIATGDIRLIAEDTLRAAIVSLHGDVQTTLEALSLVDQNDWENVQAGVREREAIEFGAGRPDTVPLASYQASPALAAAYANHGAALGNHLFYVRGLRARFGEVLRLVEASENR